MIFTHAMIEAQAKLRPAGYVEELKAIARTVDDRGMDLDVHSEAYKALGKKYRVRQRGMGDMVMAVTSAVGLVPCPRCRKDAGKLNDIGR